MTRERLSVGEVGNLLGVTASTIRSYLSRDQIPKPSPCPCCGASTWARADILTWQQSRPGRTGRPRKDTR